MTLEATLVIRITELGGEEGARKMTSKSKWRWRNLRITSIPTILFTDYTISNEYLISTHTRMKSNAKLLFSSWRSISHFGGKAWRTKVRPRKKSNQILRKKKLSIRLICFLVLLYPTKLLIDVIHKEKRDSLFSSGPTRAEEGWFFQFVSTVELSMTSWSSIGTPYLNSTICLMNSMNQQCFQRLIRGVATIGSGWEKKIIEK